MSTKWAYTLAGLAALSGAAGVMESAAAAHVISDPLLKTSADFLIVNAAAVIAVSGFALGARRSSWLLVGASALLLGSFLFCGELSAHVFLGRKPLPLGAPIGGALTILGWLIVALAAFAGVFQRDRSPR
jgi:uncharacterized membrane protein YgdD (TMEM256/DUF423 family)